MKPLLPLLTFCSALLVAPAAHACPSVGGLPDFNCDGEAVISVLGDSLVYGTEDVENDGKGGYVLRTQRALENVTFNNFGFPGITTNGLTSKVDRAFGKTGNGKLAAALAKSDLIILDVGRNDEWSMSAHETAAALRKLRRQIEDDVTEVTQIRPLVVTAVLMITRTVKKAAWISELNRLITSVHSKYAPTDLHFDSVPWRLCGSDRIHPTSKGYDRLSRVFIRYLLNAYPEHVKELRKDKDADGLYDMFERSHFGTNPHSPDTDGDGLLDGDDPDPLNP